MNTQVLEKLTVRFTMPLAHTTVLVLVAVGAALAGCGGGGGGGSPAASPRPAQPPPADSPSPPPAVDLRGVWTTRQSLQGSADFNGIESVGILEITDSGGSVLGDWRSTETLMRSNFSEAQSSDSQFTIVGTPSGLGFVLTLTNYSIQCTYRASVIGSLMDGTVDCPSHGMEGLWFAERGPPETTALPPIASVDAVDFSTCALAMDGRTFCWGKNILNELGSGDTIPRITPGPSLGSYAFSKVSLSTGGALACGIDLLGDAYCWGNRAGGRLGDGFSGEVGDYAAGPVPVSGGHRFMDIAAGGDHVCAVSDSGVAYCWGQNQLGQLGTGDFTDYTVPQAVAGGLEFKSITAHVAVSCGLAIDGSAHCWGDGFAGNLGNGTTDVFNTPTPVSGNLVFDSLQLGIWTACGVTTAGAAYCWGFNGSGELGTGAASDIETMPVLVSGGILWKNISPGLAVTCGVSQAGDGYCWGGNLSGERGDGAFPAPDRPAPGPVAGDIAFESIDADWHSCGVSIDGNVYCWGPGGSGSVGDGTLLDRGTPTLVLGSS